MFCELCGKEKKVLVHHISYEPEITAPICTICHTAIHAFERLSVNSRKKFIGWIEKYSSGWVQWHGRSAYTKHGKEQAARWAKEHKERMKELGAKWRKEHKGEVGQRKKNYYQENKEIMLPILRARNRRRYWHRKHSILGQGSLFVGM